MTETRSQQNTQKKSSGNKLIVIVVIVLVLLAAAGYAMKMASQKAAEMVGQKVGEKFTEKMIESAAGGKADVDIQKDGMTIKTKDGTFSTGKSLPENFPKDVPVYPGAEVSGSSTSNQGDSAGSVVVLTTKDSQSAVMAYYTKEVAASGWTVEGTQTFGDASMVMATKDSRSLTVAIAVSDGTTTVTIGLGEK